jgi:putative ABC transport system permease protein
MNTLWHDIRYGLRSLLKEPGFTVVAIITLALGIGANTAIFSVIDAVLLRPLPFKDPERLVAVWSTDSGRGLSKQYVSYPDLTDWRAASRSFEHLGGWFGYDMTLVGDGEPARVKGVGVAGDLLAALGVQPVVGRTFRADDDRVVVLSDELWRRRFNADPNVVGRGVTLSGESYTVVGVMPGGFQFPIQADAADVWLTWNYAVHPGPASKRDARLFEVVGRLRPDAAVAEAQAELGVIAAALSKQYPETNKDIGVQIVPAAEELVKNVRRSLLVLFGAVAGVLLIACVNVANLLLVRAAGRRREMAVRAALGASRARVSLQLLIESLLLAVAGGIVGGLVALWGVDALVALTPEYLPGAERIAVDSRVLAFTLLVSLVTGVLFGLAPAWHASKIDLTTALKDSPTTTAGGAGGRRLRGALVVAEMSLALVLLVGAALLINSFWRLRQVDPGFDPQNVLSLRLSLPYEKYSTAQADDFFRKLQPRVQAIPGVRAASAVFPLPLYGDPVFDSMLDSFDMRLDIEGRPLPRRERPRTDGRTVQPNYFRAMGIRLLRGRDFSERDDANALPVAIINEAVARRHFPSEDPIGKRLRLDSIFDKDAPPMRQIIGVVADVKHRGLTMEAWPEVYTPLAQTPFQEMFVVVKTDGDPNRVVGAVRGAVWEIDKDQPIYDVRTLGERLDLTVAQPRFNTLLLTVFSALALVLAAVGLYGVMAYSVAERTRELGIRMALGAEPRDILKLVVKQSLILTVVGVGLGVAAALSLTRVMSSLLYDVSATDPVIFVGVSLLLALVALAACLVPARRATKVDPMAALRYE